MNYPSTNTAPSSLVTTAIPYVNAAPHLGHALEFTLADTIARYRRARGERVQHQSGTDDNSLKNVLAASALGLDPAALVAENAAQFAALGSLLGVSWDRFISTSSDVKHRQIVESIWERCLAHGDIYLANYQGRYCVGCEQFYEPSELIQGSCPEHGTAVDLVTERNYFFRLSRYQDEIYAAIERNQIRILPAERRLEVLTFVGSGLRDFSISRSQERARNWGLSVPGDATQVVYVWFDALLNYISGLGDEASDINASLQIWNQLSRIEHVIGKGILRFHAVYWPAILLSAGLRLPSDILVHGYLTVDGRKIGKSAGNAVPVPGTVATFGSDPLRYYLLRHVRTTRDGDFSARRLALANDAELADQLGNLLHRTVALLTRYRSGVVPQPQPPGRLESELVERLLATRAVVEKSFESFALSEAADAIWDLVAQANRYIEQTRPWRLGKQQDDDAHQELDRVLSTLALIVTELGRLLQPLLPAAAGEILRRLGDVEAHSDSGQHDGCLTGRVVRPGPPLFKKTAAVDDC